MLWWSVLSVASRAANKPSRNFTVPEKAPPYFRAFFLVESAYYRFHN